MEFIAGKRPAHKFQKTDQSLVASIAMMTRATDMLVQHGGNENKELLKVLNLYEP